MGARWRKSEDDGDGEQVVVLTSSDDEEANRDLTIEIVEMARRRRCGGRAAALPGVGGGDASVSGKKKRSGRKESGGVGEVEVAAEMSERTGRKENGDMREVEMAAEMEEKSGRKERRKRKSRRREEKEQHTRAVVSSIVKIDQSFDSANDTLDEPLGSADSEVTYANDGPDNMVLRKLLRGRRYFDMDTCDWQKSCHNCGEEGHVAVNCNEKRRKPCFVCGVIGHNARHCLQAHDCFICKRRGHIAKDCPDKHQRGFKTPIFCLRCGNLGHDMFSCSYAYSAEDLLGIQCYVCKEFGHVCCAPFHDATAFAVSCYNCGQTGHSGVGCATYRSQKKKDEFPSLCYSCGEEGHFARGCMKIAKSRQWVEEICTPSRNPNWQSKKGTPTKARTTPCKNNHKRFDYFDGHGSPALPTHSMSTNRKMFSVTNTNSVGLGPCRRKFKVWSSNPSIKRIGVRSR